MSHALLTIAIPFATRNVSAIEAMLNAMGDLNNEDKRLEVRKSLRRSAVHFMSITLLRESQDDSYLIIEANIDGSEEEATKVLVHRFSEYLIPLLQAMEIETMAQTLESLLRMHTHRVGLGFFQTPGISFSGTPGMTTSRIRAEYALSRWCRRCIDQTSRPMKPENVPQAVMDAAHQQSSTSLSQEDFFKAVRASILNIEGQQVFEIAHEEQRMRFASNGSRIERSGSTSLDLVRNLRQRVKSIAALAQLLEPDDVSLLGPERPSPSLLTFVLRGIWMAISGAFTLTWPILLFVLIPVVSMMLVTAVKHLGVYLTVISVFVVMMMAVLLALAAIVLTYLKFLRTEECDIPDESPPDLARLEQVTKRENQSEQNHLAGVSVMKHGWYRRFSLRVAFWIVTQFVTRQYRPGFLGNIGTIHFARWILLPGTNKLLFFSNYDGSWESYLEDFITKAHRGLTSIWSNTGGFPKTVRLLGQGATDGDRFKRWARRQQYPTLFWYSAYPHLTTSRIRINAAIRVGLASASTEDEAAAFVSLFGSQPPRSDTVEVNEVQKIAFGSFRPLLYGKCLLLQLPSDAVQARRWLKNMLPQISFGDGPVGDSATIVSLSATGLRRLGLDEKAVQSFQRAFVQGMPDRASLLADTGDDDPKRWQWGNKSQPVDVAVLLYNRTKGGLEEMPPLRVNDFGVSVLQDIPMQKLPPSPERVTEPFGFVDGVSQPVLRGLGQGPRTQGAIHEVEPGEFILGYKDNRGYFPLTPSLPASLDPHNLLPTIRWLTDESADGSQGLRASVERDLGRNGAYLVIRQLKQNVAQFDLFLKNAAEQLASNPFPGAPDFVDDRNNKSITRQFKYEQWIAAKMIGRWKDGTSLVQFPNRPGTGWRGEHIEVEPDNAFRLGAEDPLGQRCPLGAHIRRGNPRDSQEPGSDEQIAINNRHRILRMGRPYEIRGTKPPEKGLLFMCLNGDLERQFEFIQQTWMMAKNFHGLDGEVDPVLGRGGRGGRITVPTPSGPLTITGIKDFVTVLGGGYFFLPGLRTLRYLAE